MTGHRAGAALVALALAGTASYGYLLNSINLPESLWLLILGGSLLGLLIGRWWIVAAALVTWTFPLLARVSEDEVAGLVFYVYMPLAAISIAAGVGLKMLLARALTGSPSGQHPHRHGF